MHLTFNHFIFFYFSSIRLFSSLGYPVSSGRRQSISSLPYRQQAADYGSKEFQSTMTFRTVFLLKYTQIQIMFSKFFLYKIHFSFSFLFLQFAFVQSFECGISFRDCRSRCNLVKQSDQTSQSKRTSTGKTNNNDWKQQDRHYYIDRTPSTVYSIKFFFFFSFPLFLLYQGQTHKVTELSGGFIVVRSNSLGKYFWSKVKLIVTISVLHSY